MIKRSVNEKKVANAKGYIYCDPWALSIQPKIPNHSIGLVVGLAEGLYILPPGVKKNEQMPQLWN